MCTPLQKLTAKYPPQTWNFLGITRFYRNHTLHVSHKPTQKSIQKASTHMKDNGFEYDKKDVRAFSFREKCGYVEVQAVGKSRKHVVLIKISLQILIKVICRSKKEKKKLKRNNPHKIEIIGEKVHISSGCSNCHYNQTKPQTKPSPVKENS